ncbi:hypothetical protein IT399_03560 [Candidatus Nomurabacteria bacterium]|nr:hypothetical protein [Candidatus Nomurabacteria bacterium]
MFLVVLFLAKRTDFFERTVNFVSGGNRAELVYGDATVADLVNKDSDGDGVLDWEEPLWGLDPTKKETTPGVPDSTVIAKLKTENGYSLETPSGTTSTTTQPEEKLTQTDKFSRELFSTTATLSQNGALDQTTVDKISTSLTEQIKNTVIRKTYTLADLKIVDNTSSQTVKSYFDALNNANKKYATKTSVIEVLQKAVIDENNIDSNALAELDPIIDQTKKTLEEILKISVPKVFASLHLDFINAGERLIENTEDMRLFDKDPIAAMGAFSKYQENLMSFQTTLNKLTVEINKIINN